MPKVLPGVLDQNDKVTRTAAKEQSPVRAVEEAGCGPKPSVASLGSNGAKGAKTAAYERRQVLHMLKLSLRSGGKGQIIYNTVRGCVRLVVCILLLLLAVVLALCGAYRTLALVLCSAISQTMQHAVVILRPLGFLQSNESYDDAYMLVAAHQNAQEWTLFVGDRSVVDTLLNKPMIAVL